jgi:hypothetical protein
MMLKKSMMAFRVLRRTHGLKARAKGEQSKKVVEAALWRSENPP